MESVRRQLRWMVLTGVALVVASGCAGCGTGCDGRSTVEEIDEPERLAEAIPSDVRVVVFADELGELIDHVDGGLRALPVEGDVDPKRWAEAGADLEGPGAAYLVDGGWAVVGRADPEADLDIEVWAGDGEREAVDAGPEGVKAWREIESEQRRRWASTDGRRLVVGRSLDGPIADDETAPWSIGGDHWPVDELQADRAVRQTGESDRVRMYGAVEVSDLLDDHLKGDGRAAALLDQMVARTGRIYWALRPADEPGRWIVDLESPGRTGVPSAVRNLGEARKPLPDLGGLVRAGTPGVARLSVDPDRLMELLRSTLEAGERRYFDRTMKTLEEELKIDLKGDVIDNITGQVAVVVFGLEDAIFEAEGLELLASTARLETARALVLIPFEDRDSIESVLDAFTQMSMGKLRRDAGEHTVQYAWFEDGILKWALIVSDDHLAFVDSIVASDYFQSWKRSPHPLEGVFAGRGVDTMLEGTRGMGMYLDVATIETMLDEGGDERAAWLEPIEAIRLETDVGGRPERARINVWTTGDDGETE